MKRVAAFTVICLCVTCNAYAQICAAITGDFSETAGLSVRLVGGAACSVPNGGYVRWATSYELHVDVEVTGWCQTYSWHQQLGCIPSDNYDRLAEGSNLRVNNGVNGSYTVMAANNVQSYNTCGNGNCTAENSSGAPWWSASDRGTFLYTGNNFIGGGTTGIGPAYCNMATSFYAPPLTMYAARCEPKWWVSGSNVRRVAVPGSGTVDVFLDPTTFSGAETALDAAISAWNAQLSTVGINFQRVTSSCGTGPACIKVETASIGNSCGVAVGDASDPDGTIPGNLKLQLNPAWTKFSASGLERTFLHELGHFLGDGDYSNASWGCWSNSAVMHDGFDCTTTASTTLTSDDYFPPVKTTYPGGPRATCGW